MPVNRRQFLACAGVATLAPALSAPVFAQATPKPWTDRLIEAAESQVGVTLAYDPAYVKLGFPGGDVPRSRGVCTDVVIRAYRDAFGFDLQKHVNADMRRAFSAYPNNWGLKAADSNIDHRRVPNLETFFDRRGAAVAITEKAEDYLPGDLVTQRLTFGQPHIAIVTARRSSFGGARPLVVHNIGGGARIEDSLFLFRIVGHYRFAPA